MRTQIHLFGYGRYATGEIRSLKHTVTRLTTAIILLLLAAPLTSGAQPTGKVYRVGFIWTAGPNEVSHFRKAFEEGCGPGLR
jgi:hypothetical protein